MAEEGLLDLVRDAWGEETTDRAHAYLEQDALPYLPIDSRAFALAVEGRLEPGGELETNYGKAAVEVRVGFFRLCYDTCVRDVFAIIGRIKVIAQLGKHDKKRKRFHTHNVRMKDELLPVG